MVVALIQKSTTKTRQTWIEENEWIETKLDCKLSRVIQTHSICLPMCTWICIYAHVFVCTVNFMNVLSVCCNAKYSHRHTNNTDAHMHSVKYKLHTHTREKFHSIWQLAIYVYRCVGCSLYNINIVYVHVCDSIKPNFELTEEKYGADVPVFGACNRVYIMCYCEQHIDAWLDSNWKCANNRMLVSFWQTEDSSYAFSLSSTLVNLVNKNR